MLEELRKKSPPLKQAYAFWGAFLLTGLIGVIWLAVLTLNFSESATIAELEEGRQTAGAFAQFFGQMKENISSTWQENKEVIGNLSTEAIEENNDGEGENMATSTTTTTPVTSSNNSVILIATSSQKDIKIATSSKQNQ